MNSNFRPLTTRERELLEALLGEEFPGRDQLRTQMDSVAAKEIDQDGSLALQPGSGERAPVKTSVPTEGQCADADGKPVHILLHVRDGLMTEMEVFREDSTPVLNPPLARNLLRFVPYTGSSGPKSS